jgi:hypothetical protein
MKILILPSHYITNYNHRNKRIILTYLKNILTKFEFNFEYAKQFYYLMEHYHYSHIPKILGEKNTFIIGDYYKDYSRATIPQNTRYPSLHNSPKATHISFKEAINNLTKFDAVIIGMRSGNEGIELRKIAKKKNVFVAYLDYTDHPDVYRKSLIENKDLMYRGLDKEKDFNILFKHDIPINYEDKNLYSICPMPINFENYPKLQNKRFNEKKINISFLGRLHSELQKERSFLADYIETNFNRTYFKRFAINDVNRLTLDDYAEIMNDSKIIFSPSGKVWDSVRHAEAAIYNCVPLISKPYCKLANDIRINENNSIFYKVILYNNSFQIEDVNSLKEKIDKILNNQKKYEEISSAWSKEMVLKNTLTKRAEYIINIIKKNLNDYK